MTSGEQAIAGLTRQLAHIAVGYRTASLPDSAITVARQCILDWFAVALPGSREECAVLLAEELESDGSGPCTVVGRSHRLSAHDAALINGTASHALDFDDVNRVMQGHPTVAVFSAVLAVAETVRANGNDVLTAFIAGYEVACMVGDLVRPSHYARGFHATGTLGALGAAVGAGLLLQLDEAQMVNAIGLAATQSAGLKAMFGSMAKPLHAGKAAANGVLAARLAARRFTAQPFALEDEQGFIATLSDELVRPLAVPAVGTHVLNTLFKYHAACYMTHSTLDGIGHLRQMHALTPSVTDSIDIHVAPSHLKACNIADPVSGLEAKFSLRHTAALALHQVDSSALETFSDEAASDPALAATRQRITVHGDMPAGGAVRLIVRTKSGDIHETEHDTGIVNTDLAAQGDRIIAKFRSLATPVIGSDCAERLLAGILQMDQTFLLTDLTQIVRLSPQDCQ
jgi:2-methylcitrate dehydratase PrpD